MSLLTELHVLHPWAHWYLAVICFLCKISQASGLDLRLSGRRYSVEYLCDQSPPNPMSLFCSPECSKQLSRWSQSIGNLENQCGAREKWRYDEAEDDVQTVKNRSVLNSKSNVSKQPCILMMDSFAFGGRSSGPTTNFQLHHGPEVLVFTEDSEEEEEANQTTHSQTAQTA
ncbi:hypothetical protein cypCar_00034617 [Cyprinus carpio]|nr:hypothetical protein cypCar_00034617 [Cyprinus carpio]